MVRPAVEPVVGLGFVVFWLFAEVGRFEDGYSGWATWGWLPFAMIGLAIAVSKLLPWLAVGLIGILLLGQLLGVFMRFGQTAWPAYLGLLVVGVVVSRVAPAALRRMSLPLFCVYAVAIAALLTLPWLSWFDDSGVLNGWGPHDPQLWSSFVIWSIVILTLALACWFIGFGLRARSDRNTSEALRREAQAELAVSEAELVLSSERDRIAQDVHDIMAHSLSVILAQADGARYLAEKRPESTTTSLIAIAQSARESLVEVRMLIDSLVSEPEGHSHPTLDDLEALLERMRAAGLAVELDVFGGQASLTTGQQLAVYRIVQESLTNALKHAGSQARARIAFDWRGPGLALTVTSRGESTATAGVPAASGAPTRGVRGMRERARLAGGWLTVGTDDDDPRCFLVTAFIPTAEALRSGAVEGSVAR
ncbi:signal transduction histidine kinase [Compostimonas suwonensis]|uniref:histidine kinase n=2 Tax=Compostimonas suwonensis TaxID=1048394 RepID=A0A2M9C061_9MICO|nr:signal transduction histidine kinase [Compostimonas suwonensis]